jgi:hypothetical protein
VRVTDTSATISDGLPVEGQWDDQLSTISEVTEDSRFMLHLQQAESSLSNGSNNDWKMYQLFDNDDWSTPEYASKHAPCPVTPATPSTVDSATVADSQFSSLRIQTDSLMSETESTSSSNHASNSTKSKSAPRLAPSDFLQATVSPQLRDQMKYFMGKHVSSSDRDYRREEEKKTTQ